MSGIADGTAVAKWRAHDKDTAHLFIAWMSRVVGVRPDSIKSASLDGLELTVECYPSPKRLNAAKTAAETYVKVIQLDGPPPLWPEDWMLS